MKKIKIHEVGLRDGLQIEKKIPRTETKIEWARRLAEAGIGLIQAGSFTNPKKAPQMADTDEIVRLLKAEFGEKLSISGLALNGRGIERALDCGVDMICIGVSASETHSRKNTGKSISEALDSILPLAKTALSEGSFVQASVQSAFGCGFEGEINKNIVYDILKKYADSGIKLISLADTAGYANPYQVKEMIGEIMKSLPGLSIACHFHNTYGLGLANCYEAWNSGADYIETAIGGLGGCPFTKLPSGNTCTEDFANLARFSGMDFEINLGKLSILAEEISAFLEKPLPGYYYKAGPMQK